MKKFVAIALVGATVLSAGTASAQSYNGGRYNDNRGSQNSYNDNRGYQSNNGGRQYDRNDNRRGNGGQNRNQYRGQNTSPRYYGGQYGYNGYQGQWRTGQRYTHYNQSRYQLNDYRRYGLPAPRAGYRYYRDDNGDVVMAAIASGIIGLIIGGALNGN